MTIEKTQRGFDYTEFQDLYGNECSLQKSSLGSEHAIWLGISDPNIQAGPPWREVTLPKDHLIHSRMHLSIDQVKEFLPHLLNFVNTGELE